MHTKDIYALHMEVEILSQVYFLPINFNNFILDRSS